MDAVTRMKPCLVNVLRLQEVKAEDDGMMEKPGKVAAPMMPTALTSELCEYEKIREANINEREGMMAALMADFNTYKKDAGIGPALRKPVKKRKWVERKDDDGEVRFAGVRAGGSRKSARLSGRPEDQDKLGSEVTGRESEGRRGLAEEAEEYDSDDFKENEELMNKRRGSRSGQNNPNDNVVMPENVTEAMLDKVCDRYGEKTYNRSSGTSCHQCRQKTTDTKSICRSGQCVGVRGQFCGRCLEIRYGEDAREALLDPAWSCPPCRGFCNCSICRARSGKGATGILHHLAQAKGFGDVAAYLKSLQKKGKDDQE